MQNWVILNDAYLNYLRKNYEPRIPFTNYGNNRLKPFFGVLMIVNNLAYVTQVSSAKPRHSNMKQQLDFYKITQGDNVISVVNLNYMFPVPLTELTNLKYKNLDQYVCFNSEKQKSNYIALLKYEMCEINKLPLAQSAKQIYELKYLQPDHAVSKRSFDFKKLEQAANEWLSK